MFSRFVDCNGEPELSVLLDQKALVFVFLIENNDTFHFLSIQLSLSVKETYDFLFNLKYFLNGCNKF